MPDARPAYRFRWFLLLAGFMLVAALGMLAIQGLGAQQSTAPILLPTIGPLRLTEIEALGVSLQVPANWHTPVVLDSRRFVLSPDGSEDMRTTAGPFLFVVLDAVEAFRGQINFSYDLVDPVAQLDHLVKALNRQGPRFQGAAPYDDAQYPAAIVRGYERGNTLTIVLMRTDAGHWIYVGAQMIGDQFAYYEQTVFKPATDSLVFRAP